ncbi:MAG: hypothetical protein ACR2GH_20600 [Pseudonocardia sp.]
MTRIWGPPTADEAGQPRRPASGETGGVPPAAGLAPQPDTTPEQLWLSWITCTNDGADHAVTDKELTTGAHHDSGRYQALCGHIAIPEAMITPPGRRCAACRATLDAQQRPAPKQARWRRWLTRMHTLLKPD